MFRTRAERRHHERQLKAIRRHYNNSGSRLPTHSGVVYQTPCSCSCWMCGNQCNHHGLSWQEINDSLRYTDYQEDRCTTIRPKNICKYLNMSLRIYTFNTRKDRERHSKPLPHWRVQYATRCRVKHLHYADRYVDHAPA